MINDVIVMVLFHILARLKDLEVHVPESVAKSIIPFVSPCTKLATSRN